MTIQEFFEITDQRIPTPTEFVEFAESQQWKFRVNNDGASLLADKTDPVAVAFARMLSREPYRTNVLKLLAARGVSTAVSADRPRPLPVAKPEPKIDPCSVCKREFPDEETRERMADAAHCSQGGSRAVTDGNGVYHPEEPRCPFKR